MSHHHEQLDAEEAAAGTIAGLAAENKALRIERHRHRAALQHIVEKHCNEQPKRCGEGVHSIYCPAGVAALALREGV